MATIKPFRTVVATSAKELSFTPPSGRAAIVFFIACLTNSAGWATVKSANATVGFFEIGPDARNHLPLVPSDSNSGGVLDILKGLGLPTEFPVPEGEKFVVSTSVTCDYIIVRYREVEPGDVTPDMPNAKAGKEALRIFYGTNSSDITSSGWSKLNKSLNPSEMHNWPFEEVASPFDSIEIHAIGVLDYEENTYTGGSNVYGRTERVRIWKGTELLFHPQEDGFVCLGDGAEAGSANKSYAGGTNELPYAGAVRKGSLFVLPEPLVVAKGEELAVEVKVAVDTNAKVTKEELRCALFSKVIRG